MIRLPEEFKEIEEEVNKELRKLEARINDLSKLDVVTSQEKFPHNKEERKLQLFIDKDGTHKGILKSQGRNYTFNLTEVT